MPLLFVTWAEAQNKKFAEEMFQALHIHDTAKVIKSELASLSALEKLVEKYPKEWLPGYWTAYIYTQVARLDGRDPNFPKDLSYAEGIKRAQKYLEIARQNAIQVSNKEKSDLMVMQGFIYSFLRKDRKYDSLMHLEYRKALQIDPTNVNLQVQSAINVASKETATYADVVASLAVFDYAASIFQKVENRALTTYYTKDFIGFWRGRAMEKLTKLINQP